MLIYILPFIFSFILYCYVKYNDYDLVSPVVLFSFGYIVSSLCAIINVKRWNIDLHTDTFCILVLGILIYFFVGVMTKKYCFFYNDKDISQPTSDVINYNLNFLKFFIIFQIIILIIWFYQINCIVSSFSNTTNFFDAMVLFRNWSSYSTQWLQNTNYIILNQIIQISIYSPWVISYVLLYNYIANNGAKIDFYLVSSLIISIFQILLTGGRGGVVFLGLGCVVYYTEFYSYKYNKVINFNIKIILKLLLAFVFFASVFVLAKAIVGRGFNDISIDMFIPYITVYSGGPIQLLDMFLKDPIAPSNIIGKETFYGMNMLLSRLGILDLEPYIVHLEFRNASTGAFLGNVYTSYRSYIYDFGYTGMIVLTAIFSFISHWIYYKCIEYRRFEHINIYLILYAIMSYCIFFDFVRNYFFLNIVSASGLKQCFIIVFLYYALLENSKTIKNHIFNKQNIRKEHHNAQNN